MLHPVQSDRVSLIYWFLCDHTANTSAVKNRVGTKHNHGLFLPRSHRIACRMSTTGELLYAVPLYREYVLRMFFGELSPTNRLNKTFFSFFTSFLLPFEKILCILFDWNIAYNRMCMYCPVRGTLLKIGCVAVTTIPCVLFVRNWNIKRYFNL